MKRTTILLDESLIRRAKQKARSEGRSFAALVREAVTIYVSEGRAGSDVPTIAGGFSSGERNTSEDTGELLWSTPHQ
jgi:hypothetical protein